MTPTHYFLWIFVISFSIYAFFSKEKKIRLFVIFLFLLLINLRLVFFGSDARELVPEQQYSDLEIAIYNQGITDIYYIIKRETIHFIGITLVVFILCIRGFRRPKPE